MLVVHKALEEDSSFELHQALEGFQGDREEWHLRSRSEGLRNVFYHFLKIPLRDLLYFRDEQFLCLWHGMHLEVFLVTWFYAMIVTVSQDFEDAMH